MREPPANKQVPTSASSSPTQRSYCRNDRLLVTMALLRLGLLRKKVLLLVNSIDAGFRLRLFLETFGVRSAVLNAELPLNSRHHILQACIFSHPCRLSQCTAHLRSAVFAGHLGWDCKTRLAVCACAAHEHVHVCHAGSKGLTGEPLSRSMCSDMHACCEVDGHRDLPQEFNKGLFDYLIATDDIKSAAHDRDDGGAADRDELQQQSQNGAEPAPAPEANGAHVAVAKGGKPVKKGKKRKGGQKDEEFGITRCALRDCATARLACACRCGW